MKAFVKKIYGGPEVLHLEEVDKPLLKDDHLLIKVFANSVNPADWHILRGDPYFARFTFGLFKPKEKILGADFAGVVEALGREVRDFNVGDRVFGELLNGGAFAEYVSAPENVCAKMPRGVDFATMACLPIAGLTALQALTTHGKLKQKESVLINGASGGVGHFAVQIAKALGGNVTAVCSSKNVDFVRSLGADQVLAYDRENIHEHNGKYDIVIDTNGNLFFDDFTRMGRRGVLIGFTTLGLMVSNMLKKSFSKFSLVVFTSEANTDDLKTLASFIENGKISVHIDKTFPYSEIPKAIEYIERMRTRGKVAMVW